MTNMLMRGCTALCLLLLSGILHAQSSLPLYIGTYTNTGSHGVYVARFDTATGVIRVTDSIAADNPSYLALNAAGNRLYAVNENGGSKPGAVSSYQYDATAGRWLPLNTSPVPSGGDHPCYISLNSKGSYAVVANYSGGSLTVLPIAPDGRLLAPEQVVQQYGSSVVAARQQAPHVHTAVFTPKENFVVMADLGTDMLKAYPFKPGKHPPLDTLKPIAFRASPGSGPRHIAFHPRLNVFYVLGELTGRVSVHGFNKKRIALLQSIAADTVSKQPGSADIHVSPDGRFLYASNRADANSLAVYRIDAGDGRLLPAGLVATGGRQPRNFTLDPSGRFLLVANQATNNIVVFRIDPQTGIPAPTGFELTLPTPVCLVFKKP